MRAAGSDFGLNVLRDISQNLPTQAKYEVSVCSCEVSNNFFRSLYKVQVDKNVRSEIQTNQKVRFKSFLCMFS